MSDRDVVDAVISAVGMKNGTVAVIVESQRYVFTQKQIAHLVVSLLGAAKSAQTLKGRRETEEPDRIGDVPGIQPTFLELTAGDEPNEDGPSIALSFGAARLVIARLGIERLRKLGQALVALTAVGRPH